MKSARITTGWIGDGKSTATAFRPAITADHSVTDWTDKTGADPTKGEPFEIEVVVEKAKLAAIKADVKYAGKVRNEKDIPVKPDEVPEKPK